MARRREFEFISMSMLDAITCGFGAVILIFMIVAINADFSPPNPDPSRSADARRIQLQIDVGRRNMAALQDDLEALALAMAETQAVRQQINLEIEKTEQDLRLLLEDASASEEMIEQLRGDLERLSTEKESLALENDVPESTGNFVREIEGEGYRQYLTGMKMGGQRVLILVDTSTSMLGKSLPEIIDRRIRSDDVKREARKWRQVVDTVAWITAQLEPGQLFQVIVFNREAWAVVEGTEGQWLAAAADGEDIDRVMDAMEEIVPGQCRPGAEEGMRCGGTSLHAAFGAMSSFAPRPDNVYLLVDGLPTMGSDYPDRAGVTGRERMQHFERATRGLPTATPINVLLYPLEGDPRATPAYWALALETGGALMAPSEDWP